LSLISHPERPERISEIKLRLDEYGLLERMKHLPSRKATEEELCLVHDKNHIQFIQDVVKNDDLMKAAEAYDSIYLHPSSYECARLSAGSVLQTVDEVLNGLSRSGICIVRPPGHHAECSEPNGFCLFNNVAVAAKYATKCHGLQRVLIVDWDVHHGQGTQHIFQDDPQVLYISIHRYDNGSFYPRGEDGNYTEVGVEKGRGFNVNIPWNSTGMGDLEYALTFQKIIMPIAYEFNPQLVIVSAGFDAADGDTLGKCKVSAEAYGYFTHWLSSLANGKIILALEGGYNVHSISHSMAMCAKSLLGDPLPKLQISPKFDGIKSSARESLMNVMNVQSEFWSSMKFNKKLPNFDLNENSIENDLAMNLNKITLNDDATDSNKNPEQNIDESAGCSSSHASTSNPVEKNKTLTEFLQENLEVKSN
jgi:histone deacetylase 6